MGFLCHTYSVDSLLFGLRSPCCCLCTGCNGSHLLCPEELPTNSGAQAHRKLLPGPEARQEASLHFPVKTQNDQSAHWRLTETAPPGSNHPVSLLGDSVSICLCQPRNTPPPPILWHQLSRSRCHPTCSGSSAAVSHSPWDWQKDREDRWE